MASKKVLITGGTGFVGSYFAHRFLEMGHEVHLIIRAQSDFWRIEDIKDRVSLHSIDLALAEEVNRCIVGVQPNYILHFATYGAYQGRQKDIPTTITTNVLGTVNLVNACSRIPFDCFINSGSTSEYGLKDYPVKENELLEPDNLYGVTKAAGTLYCQYLAKKLDLPLVTMRLFSLYGPYEDGRRLIPTVLMSYIANTAPHLSTPASVRDFTYVEDVLSAYLLAIAKIDSVKGNIFNIGAGMQHSIGDVVAAVKEITGSTLEPEYGSVKPVQSEPKQWVADITKAKDLLGWQPRFTLKTGLEESLHWFKRHPDLYLHHETREK